MTQGKISMILNYIAQFSFKKMHVKQIWPNAYYYHSTLAGLGLNNLVKKISFRDLF